jgi:translation initiation factor 2B subunit (eIF-2B alpha/beta/delta family)
MIFKSFFNRWKFNKISRDIKSIKIQGARNIAKSALEAYSLFPSKSSKNKLVSLRPTEPMLQRVLEEAEKGNYSIALSHFDKAQNKINIEVNKLIKEGDVIFTHCHSTNVINALIYAKKKGKHFEVYNTETRPLFQGRKTSKELSEANIKVTQFVDSAFDIALSNSQGTKKVSKVFLGADAITKKGVINKVGSGAIAKLADLEKIPVYIIADSWKFTNKNLPLEQRDLNEVWNNAPKKVKRKNPAFEFIEKKNIHSIISELGKTTYSNFLKK